MNTQLKRVILESLAVICMILITGLPASGADTTKPIRLGYLQNDLHTLAALVALEKGFFSEEGLHVKVEGIFKAGPEMMNAFAADCLDVGYLGEAPVIVGVANKAAQVVVLAQVNKEGSAIVVRNDSPIKKFSDLAGKTVAVPGYAQMQEFLMQKALSDHGIAANRVNIIVLKPPEMIGALRASQIDAFVAWEPYVAETVTMGIGRALLRSADIWKDHPCCVLVVDSRFFNKHRDATWGIVRAHVRATDYIHKNKQGAIDIGVKYTGLDRETVRLAMEYTDYTYNISTGYTVEYVNFLTKLGYIKVSNPAVFINSFFDDTILRSIVRK
jgi:NitT/TauT family transport system substrate-binding protein